MIIRTIKDDLAGKLRTTPALWRPVRRLSDGRFRIDKAAIAKEAKLEGIAAIGHHRRPGRDPLGPRHRRAWPLPRPRASGAARIVPGQRTA